jgi:hypothetical protein
MRFSATEAAFEGFRIVRRDPLAIVFWSLAYVLTFVAVFGLVGGQLAGVMAQVEALQGTEPDVADLQAVGQSYFTILGVAMPLGLVLGAVLSAGVARAVLNPSEKAFGYLRLGGDELRVLAVNVILTIVMGVGFFVLAMIVGVVAGVVAQSNPGAAVLVGVLLGLAALVLVGWIGIRLCLAVPLTMAEKRIAPFASFAVTRGKVFSLLGMAVIALIMSLLVSLLGSVIALPVMMVSGGGLEQLAALEGQSTQAILQTAAPGLIAWGIVNAVVSALQLAVVYAPFAAAYRDIKGLPYE